MQVVKLFNPCSLGENEQIPAKIWELLRRNDQFRDEAHRFRKLDEKARRETEEHHRIATDLNRVASELGNEQAKLAAEKMQSSPRAEELTVERDKLQTAIAPFQERTLWEKSRHQLDRARSAHPFAGIALEWLVPEPQIFVTRRTQSPKGKRIREQVCQVRPDDLGKPMKQWPWRSEGSHAGWSMVRGPEVHYSIGNKRSPGDQKIFLNEWRGWKPDKPLFNCDTPWPQAPEGFRSKFTHLWRSRYDCRPKNPISKDRSDSPDVHETTFFRGWNLMQLVNRATTEIRKANDWLKQAPFPSVPSALGSLTSIPQAQLDLTKAEQARLFTFGELARNYRIFAIPKTILTKGAAIAIGKQIEVELKKGSTLYGDLLKKGLLNEGDVLGASSDWQAFLRHYSGKSADTSTTGHFYRHAKHVKNLAKIIYPTFDVEQLFARPTHRSHGKRYTPKECGTK